MDSAVYDEVQANNADFMKFWANGDFKGLSSQLYTENCKTMAPGCDTLHGRQAVQELFTKDFEQGLVKVLLKTDEIGPGDAANAAYEYGHYTFFDKDDKEVDHGKYIVIWKRIDGKLRMYIDMFNSNKA